MEIPITEPDAAWKIAPTPRLDWRVWVIAAAIVALHLATNSRYGFHRDELQFLSDARHLDWGFVCYPPLTSAVERVSMALFGLSLVGLRLFSVLAQAIAIVLAAGIARQLGGKSIAQSVTALAVALSPLPLFEGTEFQYTTFDYLWWVLAAWCAIRLLKSEDPRWWLGVGAALGLGLETKYTICFLICGILGGLILTPARRYLLSAWFWAGVAVALLLFLPNLLWQVRHGFISVTFLQHIHVRDVGQGRTSDFWLDQFKICANVVATPLWVAGLIGFLATKRYRMVAWMYLIPLALFAFGKGRGYYLAAAYPMLMAMGSVLGERWVSGMRRGWRWAVVGAYTVTVTAFGALVCVILVPIAPPGPVRDFSLKVDGDLREEFGWEEMVRRIASIRDQLPAEQRGSVGILVGNYGEQGAVEILGPRYGLPLPISVTNSAWLRSFPTQPPSALIVLGFSQSAADDSFEGCRLVGHNANSEGIKNEESQHHADIFLCGQPRKGWAEFWKENQRFG
jgi:4-amino-4-deoxy-L-arabinose transferase-like glycosyltransferase